MIKQQHRPLSNIYTVKNNNRGHYEVTGATAAVDEPPAAFPAVAFAFLLRPHLTPTRSPSISSPLAQACAACSAEARSLKLTNAHLKAMGEG
jgi:hypothetical protein